MRPSSQRPGPLALSPGPALSIAEPSKEGIFDLVHRWSERRTIHIDERVPSILQWWVTCHDLQAVSLDVVPEHYGRMARSLILGNTMLPAQKGRNPARSLYAGFLLTR